MKTILQTVWIASALAVVSVSLSDVARAQAAPVTGNQSQADVQPGIILRGSDVLNAKVFSQKGEELGHIRDVLFDQKTGQIAYAVLGMGGWQGLGEKFAIVPWQLVKLDEQKAENYVLQIEREKFRTAPVFERDQWSTVTQPDYLAKVQKHYTAPSQPQQAKVEPPTPASPPPSEMAQPEQQTAQKPPPEATPARQAEQRPRKEGQQAQRQRPSSGNQGRVGTEE